MRVPPNKKGEDVARTLIALLRDLRREVLCELLREFLRLDLSCQGCAELVDKAGDVLVLYKRPAGRGDSTVGHLEDLVGAVGNDSRWSTCPTVGGKNEAVGSDGRNSECYVTDSFLLSEP
jgi:hypothetical protein